MYDRYRVPPEISSTGISFRTVEGLKQLEDFKGENLLVVFYAKWCGQCMGEMKPLEQAQQELAADDFRILALTDDTKSDIEKVRSHFGVTYGLYQLENSLQDHGVYTIPTAYVLNKNGEVVFEHVGVLDWTDPELIEELRSLVKS